MNILAAAYESGQTYALEKLAASSTSRMAMRKLVALRKQNARYYGSTPNFVSSPKNPDHYAAAVKADYVKSVHTARMSLHDSLKQDPLDRPLKDRLPDLRALRAQRAQRAQRAAKLGTPTSKTHHIPNKTKGPGPTPTPAPHGPGPTPPPAPHRPGPKPDTAPSVPDTKPRPPKRDDDDKGPPKVFSHEASRNIVLGAGGLGVLGVGGALYSKHKNTKNKPQELESA